MKLDRDANLKKLISAQKAIIYESSEDEGAAEFHGELQSVIDVVSSGISTDDDIRKAAEWVGWVLL